MKPKIFFCLWILIILVTAAIPVRPVIAQTPSEPPAPVPPQSQSFVSQITRDGQAAQPVFYIADPTKSDFSIGIPETVQQRLLANITATSTFVVDYVPAGGTDYAGYVKTYFNTSCITFLAEAKTAFDYAVYTIWQNLLNSTVPIHVQACWANLGSPSILGFSYPSMNPPFANAPFPNTQYTAALGNTLIGYDVSGTTVPEIVVVINSGFSYYFGTDNGTPGNQYSLATVVLHEVGHGLGFSGGAYVDGANGLMESPLSVYDQFTKYGNGDSASYLYSITNGPLLKTYLTSNSVYFHGSAAKTANGNQPVKLYAPTSWADGSSYSHLDYTTYRWTQNALMIYSLGFGTTLLNPGPVTLGMFADMGWPFPPTLITTTNSSVAENLPAGTAVGAFVAADPNTLPAETFTYALAPGGVDNALFQISGSSLLTSAIFNYEEKNSYSIRVRVTDHTNLSYEQNLTISIQDIDEPLTRLTVFPFIQYGMLADSTILTLTNDDPDFGETFTYTFVDEPGNDNSMFTIIGNELKTTIAMENLGQTFPITIQVTNGKETVITQLTLTVVNIQKIILPAIYR